jgi:lipopolysaccharide export system protein LptA
VKLWHNASFTRCHNPNYNGGMSNMTPLLCFLFLLALLVSPQSLALPEDNAQPIHIAADKAVRDEKTGLTVYSGNVHINQGSIRIEADQITIYRIETEGDKIVAEGSPAHMQQQPKTDGPLMHAWGAVIEFYRTEERIQLRQNARLEQDGSTVRGDVIDYFIPQQLVKATGGASDSTRRVEVVIPPHKLEE